MEQSQPKLCIISGIRESSISDGENPLRLADVKSKEQNNYLFLQAVFQI